MTTDTGEIVSFYEQNADAQWSRFDQTARVEEYVLHRVLDDHFPAEPAVVADIGGGNGRQAFRLAEYGYEVHLCDLTPALVADARTRGARRQVELASAVVADARSLPWPDSLADAALLLGPLYCLTDAADRLAVLREALRVVRPGGVVVCQFFTRVGGLRWILEAAPAVARNFDWRGFLRTGVFGDAHIPDGIRAHYYSTPDEAVAQTREAGWEVVRLQGMDAPAPGTGQSNLARAPRRIVAQWGEVALCLGALPANLSAGTHLLLVARRPG
ncbi:methyltransferase domain-containing protein [Actinokineospora auranticolor]|uniref:Ubiquinone/menaquinone biosynthesis C-methylase UbiE n=1 Tax=Actinokineospora auranticolor TaxID=155976 RepID=A0A2S6GK51_9PSEU|nr:class I SAM-dependent methyltransferase [Actinokineospora auranticolor]PPK65585.1 ubiquinone/menaquinone biosynthesis C-methylase UbiE [Actinokineospora auranticolor]